MKKLIAVFGLIFFALGYAQVPVTALHLDPAISLPSGTQRVLGADCLEAVEAFAGNVTNFNDRTGEGCYVTDLTYMSGDLALQMIKLNAELAGYELRFENAEDLNGTGGLGQGFVHPSKDALVFIYLFEQKRVSMLVMSFAVP